MRRLNEGELVSLLFKIVDSLIGDLNEEEIYNLVTQNGFPLATENMLPFIATKNTSPFILIDNFLPSNS